MKLVNFPVPIVPVIALFCRLILGSIFLYAGLEKIIAPREFAASIYYYQLLPDWAINMLAVILPWLEVVLAAVLIAGIYVRGASLLAALLFLVFAIALTVSLVRGLDISCGCFGSSGRKMNWLYLFRDTSLLIMSLVALLFDRGWRYFFLRQ